MLDKIIIVSKNVLRDNTNESMMDARMDLCMICVLLIINSLIIFSIKMVCILDFACVKC